MVEDATGNQAYEHRTLTEGVVTDVNADDLSHGRASARCQVGGVTLAEYTVTGSANSNHSIRFCDFGCISANREIVWRSVRRSANQSRYAFAKPKPLLTVRTVRCGSAKIAHSIRCAAVRRATDQPAMTSWQDFPLFLPLSLTPDWMLEDDRAYRKVTHLKTLMGKP